MDYLLDFIDLLANDFYDVNTVTTIAELSGLTMGEIDFSGPAINFWLAILKQAAKEKKLKELRANIEYDSSELDAYFKRYDIDAATDGKTEPADQASYIPFSTIINNISPEQMAEVKRVDCNRSNARRAYYETYDDDCTIAVLLGKSDQNVFSLAERVMLERIDYTQSESDNENSIWVNRNSKNNRIDELIFKIRPTLALTKRIFLECLNRKFEIFNEQKELKFSTLENYKTVSISLDYAYKDGSRFINEFISWLYDFFSKINTVQFRIYLLLTGIPDQQVQTISEQLKSKLANKADKSVLLLHLNDTASLDDINLWKGECNVSYADDNDFYKDLDAAGVRGEILENYKQKNSLSMKHFECYQNALYDKVHKS